MALDRVLLDQLRHLVRPIATRVANSIARGVVQLVDDGTKMQLVQLGVLAGETVDRAENFQAYGFSSVPLTGSEAVVVFPGGDRSHPLVVAVSDRGSRPTGGQPGDVTLYNAAGAKVKMLATGDVEIQPAPGGSVLIRNAAGATDSLVTKTEFNGHVHATAGTGTPSVPTVLATGTTVLKAQ